MSFISRTGMGMGRNGNVASHSRTFLVQNTDTCMLKGKMLSIIFNICQQAWNHAYTLLLHIAWSDVIVIRDYNSLWGNMAYCVKLSGEDLSRYSNKIESISLRKCPYIITILIRKWCHNNKHITQVKPLAWMMKWYGMKEFVHCQRVYNQLPAFCTAMHRQSPEENALWVRVTVDLRGALSWLTSKTLRHGTC